MNVKQQSRLDTKFPAESKFYKAFTNVSHEIRWADGTKIFVFSAGTTYNEYIFRRTDEKSTDGGQWFATGGAIDTTAPQTW